MEHILRLTDDALTGLQANRLGVAVFKDVEKAFDSVWHNGLRYKLMNSELPNKIIRSSFISNRTITVKINVEMSDKVKLIAGTPRGSVLSPLLFLMYVNDIPVDPMNNQVNISQFADDLGMWTYQYRNHKTLSALEKWCSKWRIKLNAKKTQLIVLEKNGRQHKKIKLHLFGEEIDHVEVATRLGVTISKTFNFQSHIKMAISKANRRLNLLRLLNGTNWGCKIHQLAEIEPLKNRFQSLANKFIHSLEEHSELFKLQKDLHNAIKKRDKTNFPDELLENCKKQYGNENGM